MGDFNVTFFFQIINFLIAWWVLDRFFFRASVAEVHIEQLEKMDKQKAVKNVTAALHIIQKEQQEAFKETRLHFLQIVPQTILDNAKTVSAHSFIHVQECDISTQKMVAQELVDYLVKRIARD